MILKILGGWLLVSVLLAPIVAWWLKREYPIAEKELRFDLWRLGLEAERAHEAQLKQQWRGILYGGDTGE